MIHFIAQIAQQVLINLNYFPDKFSRRQIDYIFLISEKTGFDISCKLSSMVYYCMRYYSFTMKTYLYNFDPLKPRIYIVKLGFTGVYIIFLISAQKHRLWVLFEAVLMSTHNLCFSRNIKNIRFLIWKTFIFWWWNFQYIWIGVFS